MKTLRIFGLAGLILYVLGGGAASGQTAFGGNTLFPDLGVSRAPDGRLSLPAPLTGGRQAAPLDRGDVFAARETVAARNRRIQSLRVGATRAQLMRLFERAGGFYAVRPGEGVYSYRRDPHIKVRVWFGDAPVTQPRPTDKITRISAPYREQVAYD